MSYSGPRSRAEPPQPQSVGGRLVLAILTSARDTDDPSNFNVTRSSVERACTSPISPCASPGFPKMRAVSKAARDFRDPSRQTPGFPRVGRRRGRGAVGRLEERRSPYLPAVACSAADFSVAAASPANASWVAVAKGGLRRTAEMGGFRSFADTRANGEVAPEIGIGGRLAVPPLPHHRAYGSRTTAVRPG
jgi:hypothetical protein